LHKISFSLFIVPNQDLMCKYDDGNYLKNKKPSLGFYFLDMY